MSKKPETKKGIAFNVADAIAYADDSVVSKTLIDKEIGNITLFSFDAGQGLTEHTSPFDAVVHILDGEAAITINGETTLVAKDGMIIMPAHAPHALEAKTRFKMLLTMIRAKVEKEG
jgi:quercetin dioxygenase-like cupin family protein